MNPVRSSPLFPPLDGSIPALPGFVDFHVKHNPTREWVRLAPDGDSPARSLTFTELADATHRVARAFRPDGARTQGEVIAILIHCDTVLYLALIIGLVRAGFVVRPISMTSPFSIRLTVVVSHQCRCPMCVRRFDELNSDFKPR